MRCLFQLRVKLASTQIRPGQLGQGETISACGSAVSLSHRRKLTSHDFWLSLSSKQRWHPYSGAQTCTRIWVHAMISLWKKPWSICRWGWREIRNAFPIISWARFGAQNKDVGASSQTLLAGVRLRLWRRIERCLLWQRGNIITFHNLSQELTREGDTSTQVRFSHINEAQVDAITRNTVLTCSRYWNLVELVCYQAFQLKA